MDDAAVGLGTVSGDVNCKIISAASVPTLSLTIEVGSTPMDTSHKIIPVATSADESQKNITVENPPAGGTTIRQTNKDPAVAAGAKPADTTTKINAAASSAMDGGGVDATRSKKIFEHPVHHLMMEPWRR
jgi:hypothetical protein